MTVPHPDSLADLLARPSAQVLGAPVREALLQAVPAGDAGTPLQAPWPVIADMLDALDMLAADESTVTAALLFDLPALRPAVLPVLGQQRDAIAGLLDGQDAADQVWALHAGREAGRNSEGLRRLLLSIVHDLRVVPILLARQLARLRAATHQPDSPERRALAQLTRDIHAPLANRLGIWQLKWELEDLAFRFLQPDTYKHIARELDERRVEREGYLESVKTALREAMAANGIEAEVSGRPKHIYSIWRKMQKKHLAFDQLYDLRAVRVIVADVPTCYAALGVVHALWLPIPSEFDDYIARPKANDYRSLHTAVVGPEGRTLEVQIRTRQMHEQAELGVAAHWRYKEGKGSERSFDRKINWMRQLLEQARDGDADGLAGALDAELVEDRVYVLTPKGEVVDLPQGATPLDFAYHVHTMVGHRCRGAKVNGRIVPLTWKLHSGDRVEVLTGKEPDPRRDWLLPANGYLASARSRNKVRGWFHKLDRARNVQAGRELLDRELRRLGLLQADLLPMAKKFHADSVEDLYIAVALGDVGPSQIGRALLEQEKAPAPAPEASAANIAPRPPLRRAGKDAAAAKSRFTVQGVGNLLVQLARCCHPVAGEPIAGYITQGRGVTVHRADCASFRRMAATHPERVLPVEWGQAGGGYEVDVQITAADRKWLLKDITNLIAQADAHVLDIHSEALRDSGRARFRLRLRVADYGQLSMLLGKLDALPGVEEAMRQG